MRKVALSIVLLSLVCFYSSAEHDRTVYTYDAKGNLILEQQTFFNGFWCKTRWDYDERGNELLHFQETTEGMKFKRENTFNSRNNKIGSFYETPGYWLKDVWTYDGKGNELTHEHTSSSGSNHVRRKVYDSANQLVSAETQYSGQNTNKILETFSYDSQGLLIEKRNHINDTLNLITKYTYDQRNNEKTEIQTDVHGRTEYTFSYTYDERGNLTEEHFDLGMRWTRIEYVYDDDDRLIEKKRTTHDGRLEREESSYDQHGNQTEFYEFSQSSKDEKGRWTKTTWQYDRDQRMIRRVIERDYGSINTYDVTYNTKGLMEKEHYENNAGEWKTITCTYNAADQLVEKVTETNDQGDR